MQQLIYQSVIKQSLDNSEVISITFTDKFDWEDAPIAFEAWFELQGFNIIDMEIGADRYCWRLDLAGLSCLFHAELLTESYWFECNDEICTNAIMLGFV